MPTRTPMTAAQVEAFERRLGAAPAPAAVAPHISGVLDQSIADLRAALSQIKDVDRLRALLAAEQAGKTRKGAITAIEAALSARSEG